MISNAFYFWKQFGRWCKDYPAPAAISFILAIVGIAVSLLGSYNALPWQMLPKQFDASPIRNGNERLANCESAKNIDLIIRYCTLVIQSDEETAQNPSLAFTYRGRAYVKKGLYDRAIKDLDQAIRLDPGNAHAFLSRGDSYDNKGLYDQAIQDYDQAIKLDPGNAHIFLDRGDKYYSKDLYDPAIQYYDQAITLDPGKAETFLVRGVAYGMKSLYVRAIQDFDQAIKLDPGNAVGYLGRGTAY